MSVGVIIAAIVINIWPNWTIVDPLCTYLFSIIIMGTSIPVFKDCILVLMEATPSNIDVDQLEQDIQDLQGVEEVHDLHVWSISAGKHALTCHITTEQPLKTLNLVTDLC